MTDPDNGGEEAVHEHDDALPGAWLEAAEEYHRPPGTPRDDMWSAIRAELTPPAVRSIEEARERRVRRRTRPGWLGPAVAAAAVLVVGIGIGRLTAPGGSPGPVGVEVAASPEATAPGDPVEMSSAVRAVALEHLGRSESLLSLVRVDARTGRVEADVAGWGRGLLSETRLLLDSPAAEDPALRELLRDLELILAQVALLEGGEVEGERLRAELDIIARGLEERDVLSRIQAVLPAGLETGMTGI